MPGLAEFPQDGTRLLEIRMTGAVLVLSEKELLTLLALKPAVWQAGLQRGKALRRAERRQKRPATP
jgi:hypothetical protein